jgi:4-amino-4-deoxy-L-arabinose transferase-like glycosyltransferase
VVYDGDVVNRNPTPQDSPLPDPQAGVHSKQGQSPADAPKIELVPPAPVPPRSTAQPPKTLMGETLTGKTAASEAVTLEGDKTPSPTRSASRFVSRMMSSATPPMPPGNRPHLLLWSMLVLCLALACGPLLIDIARPLVVSQSEAVALATLRETHGRWQGQYPYHDLSGVERIVPHLQGQPLDEPPALTWLQLAAVVMVSDPPDSPEAYISIARRLSAGLALLTIACVFWAGHSIGGHRTAFFAGLIAATNPLILFFGRLATPAMLLTALTMLAIASSLWAIRPLRASPSVVRQGLGWLFCGLALGAAAFTIGLGATLIIILPILLILMLCPQRTSHLMGLIAAMLIAALMIVSWIAISQAHAIGVPWWWQPIAFTSVWSQQDWSDFGQRLAWMPLLVTAAMLPWSIWLLGAICQPFSSSSAGARLRMFLGWGWFLVLVVLLLLLPVSTVYASLLVTLAAASVMIGLLINQYNELAAAARYPRFWRVLRWYHLLVIGLLSIVVPLVVHYQPQLVQSGWLSRAWVNQPHFWFCILWGALLLAVFGLSANWTLRNYPARALVAWALWALVLFTGLTTLWTQGPVSGKPTVAVEAPADQESFWPADTLYRHNDSAMDRAYDNANAGRVISSRSFLRENQETRTPIYWLRPDAPSPGLVFYSGLHATPIDVTQLSHLLSDRNTFYLLAREEALLQALPQLSDQSRIGLRLPEGLVLWSFNNGSIRTDSWPVDARPTAAHSRPSTH